MKHSLTGLAIAVIVAAPMAAQAAADVYGRVHVAVEQTDDGTNDATNLSGSKSKGSAIGVRGDADTSMMGMKAIYQFELGLNQDDGDGSYYQRDTWVGLQGGDLGTVRLGTMATSYKQTGKLVDPLFSTAAEGRGELSMMSDLHGGSGDFDGRRTRTARYDSPSVAGAKVILGYTFAQNVKDPMYFGVHYKGGPVKAWFDYLSHPETLTQDKNGDTIAADDATAMKVGAQYAAGPLSVGLAYEIDGGAIGGFKDSEANYLFFNVGYKMGMTTATLSYGMRDDSGITVGETKDGNSGWAIAAVHSIAKKTGLYAAYGTKSPNASGDDDSTALAVGVNHAF